MVASPHYLATGAGVNILRRGGSAVDAAIAANAVLAVVKPYVCGIGGDLFAIIYADGTLHGLNGSGRAPAEARPERMRTLAGANRLPEFGPLTITVPGCVDAWWRLHQRFGRLPFEDVLADAVRYADEGFPVSAEFERSIEVSARIFHPSTPARETFLPGGSVPREGSIFRQPNLAASLESIAREGADAYYRGPIGREIVRAVREAGGVLSTEDLETHTGEWVELLSIRYRNVTVYELPPNSQGLTALIMLNILAQLPEDAIAGGEEEYIHTLSEVARLAYADRERYFTDRDHMKTAPEAFLSPAYARARTPMVRQQAATHVSPGEPGDTIYLCTADGDGNLVSLIESNYRGIGSGVMGGSTGIMLQNRGTWFSLDEEHVNVIAPGKRTMHTLMPGMAFRGGQPWLVFGTMGGSMQAQIHVELLTRMLDRGMRIDEALDAPRFDAVLGSDGGKPVLAIEDRVPAEAVEGLRARGNAVRLWPAYTAQAGHAHAIEILSSGAYAGASDPRTESLALGY
jgi:gamma-glutamyltranspeptidase/glutathione hydrolase